jgi:hypothetical protein
MARRRSANAYRTIAKIEDAANHRAQEIAQWIVDEIYVTAPRDPLHAEHTGGPALHESYYVKANEDGHGYTIRSRRRYWVYVEFGTHEHGNPQPHVEPALRAAREFFR